MIGHGCLFSFGVLGAHSDARVRVARTPGRRARRRASSPSRARSSSRAMTRARADPPDRGRRDDAPSTSAPMAMAPHRTDAVAASGARGRARGDGRTRARAWCALIVACACAVAARTAMAGEASGGLGVNTKLPTSRREDEGAYGGDAVRDVRVTSEDIEGMSAFGVMDDEALARIVGDESEDDPDVLTEGSVEDEEEDAGDEEDDSKTQKTGTGVRRFAALGVTRAEPTRPDDALAAMRAALEAEYDDEASSSGLGVDIAREDDDDASYIDRTPRGVRSSAQPPSATSASASQAPVISKPLEAYAARHASGALAPSAHGGFPVLVPGSTKDVRPQAKRRDGWVLSWSDEFDGDALDTTKWQPKVNASAPGLERHGGQQQWYTPDMCKVVDGALVLATRRREGVMNMATKTGVNRGNGEGYPFLSCWVDTKDTFTQTYGRVEIRAKIPDTTCPGIWPQHWMLPNPATSVPKQACWPLGGQIDVMQSYGKGRGGPGTRAGTVESGYHFAPQGECGVDGYARSAYPAPLDDKVDFSDGFHTFAVEWSKETLTFFVDGHVVNELSQFNVPIIPRWPFYLILNTAVSPFGMPDALDQCADDMFHYVDYVRVYKRAAVRLSSDVWHFLTFSVVVLVSFILISVFALRGAYNRDDEIFYTAYDEYGVEYKKPIKQFAYDVNDDDETASFGRQKPRNEKIGAATPLIGDVVLALPDDGTGRYQHSGRFGMSTIRRRPLPPSQSNRGYYADIWSRDADERADESARAQRRRQAKERERHLH